MSTRRRPMALTAASLAVALVASLAAAPAAAQERPTLRLAGPDGATSRVVAVGWHRGYAAVPAATLSGLGWSLRPTSDGVRATSGDAEVALRAGDPFFLWGGDLLQLVDEPYEFGGGLWVPLQLLIDFLPARMGDAYAFESDPPALRVLDEALWQAELGVAGVPEAVAEPPSPAPPAPPAETPRPAEAVPRVVVIDPGHGGDDPGALGPGGAREKDVALALGLALAEELRSRPGLEVHLTRDDDRLVPLWQRGQRATDLKGSRPGVFISLHANAMPSGRSARGFETYILSDARTEHERRVAALENAPLELEREVAPEADGTELGFILKELRNLDHTHWSDLLAGLVQERLAPIHPGPNRGVKQAPLAVITNALMPAVLVEVGFITNREEARVLGRPSFQADAARAIADAVVDFFERYPPGTPDLTGGEDR